MRVLVIGSGAREHALVLALRKDPAVTAVYAAPGNAGIAQHAQVRAVDATSGEEVAALAQELGVDLVVVGPEVPLVLGVADAVRAAGIPTFGPSAEAAKIEGSKAFAKDVMNAAGVRTAHSEIVDHPGELDAALDRFGPTWVVKDDGLAAGKGVVVTADRSVAREHGAELLEQGHPVLLESFLDGPEVSLFCLVDGETVVPLLPAQDHKRVGDGDTGPNTGGMGAYTPLPWLPDETLRAIVDDVVKPVAAEMVRRGVPFSGLLYAGLAVGSAGPAVIEFNCRFGDPETQAVLAMLDSPLSELLYATATGSLDQVAPPRWKDGAAVTVVLAAENYPARPRSGDVITGAESTGTGTESEVLHAGTAQREDGALISAGGRVLAIVGQGANLAEARKNAYDRLAGIKLPGGHFRSDIALAASTSGRSIVMASLHTQARRLNFRTKSSVLRLAFH
ncbi:phosphoribosylamine--glycine ligase [Nocardia seriolae]|uniref:phosphoribosylamine--glycine ligase n=1 Tax=Nocardia seriolae TaxID=37332 RepID=UPI0013260C82|nr:phosphoribosylamine--glycine ligase [Nocardia seriolae]MTJ66448.1 phosphoribosylamine--glycine ligase [Nocardia seriolae]